MSTGHHAGQQNHSPTRHSKELALSEREYELLLEGCRSLDRWKSEQAELVALLAGRLGMRSGEITHIQEEWVDWRRRMIEIPAHEPCHKGQDGGPCGYCRQAARQRADYNPGMSVDQALEYSWSAKTAAASRSVPFDFSPRCEIAIERFFDDHDSWPVSKTVLNRRIKAAAEAARELEPENVTPHGLRATAATYHAGRGLDVLPLQSLMGWANLSTARVYIQSSPENTARALHQIHSR